MGVIDAALDLREFLDRLKGTDELRLINGADWDREIGAISEIFAEREIHLRCYLMRLRTLLRGFGFSVIFSLHHIVRRWRLD